MDTPNDQAEQEKETAAKAAAQLIEPGMKLGLGTGSTVAHLLPAIAGRALPDLVCVATSPATERQARQLGIEVADFDSIGRLDLAIDGADQVTADHWLVKGAGGAHTREKIVAAAADRFVVIVSSDKAVDRLRPPVPVELLRFGLEATLRRLRAAGVTEIRAAAPASPDGGVIADWHGLIDDPAAAAHYLQSVPGVVGHGLFEPMLVSDVIVGRGGRAEHQR